MIDFKKARNLRLRTSAYCTRIMEQKRFPTDRCAKGACFTCINKNKEIYIKMMETAEANYTIVKCERAYDVLKKIKGPEQENCRGMHCLECKKIMLKHVQLDFKSMFGSLKQKKKKVLKDV